MVTNEDHADKGDPRGFGSFILLIGLAFAVLLVVYVYIGRLSGSPEGPPAGDDDRVAEVASGADGFGSADDAASVEGDGGASVGPGTGASAAWIRGAADQGEDSSEHQALSEPADAAVPGPLPTQPNPDARLIVYRDPMAGFRLGLLDSWRPAVVEPLAGETGAADGDRDVVFVSAATDPGAATVERAPESGESLDVSGERLAVSVRAVGESPNLVDLAATLAPGLRAVDGRPGPNATIGGQPAMILWRDETPTSPASYAAVLTLEDRAYIIAYTAGEGGAMIQEFVRALVTFEVAPDDSEDTIPPIPQPSKRYFPASALIDGDDGDSGGSGG